MSSFSFLVILYGHHLSSNERLLLISLDGLLVLEDGLLVLDEIALRSSGEIGLLGCWLDRSSLGGSSLAADHLLSLGSVVANILLGDLGGLGSVLAGHAAQLLGLGVNHISSLSQVVVDQLLVGGVDQRGEEGDGGCDKSKTPVGNNLDQVVREESRECNLKRKLVKRIKSLLGAHVRKWEESKFHTYSNGCPDVLSKENALGLNDKEVDELVDIANQSIEGLARNGVVLARSQLASQTVAKDSLAGNLGEDGDTQGHPGELEGISDNIEVSNRKDERDDSGISDTRGTGVVPRKQLGKEAVVVSQGLSSGSRLRGSLAGGCEVGKLGTRLCGLVADILGNGA